MKEGDLDLLLGVQSLGNRRQLELELGLRGDRKDDPLQGGRMLVPQEEGDLPLAALILCLQPHLHTPPLALRLLPQPLFHPDSPLSHPRYCKRRLSSPKWWELRARLKLACFVNTREALVK